jgi:hypothetical protein
MKVADDQVLGLVLQNFECLDCVGGCGGRTPFLGEMHLSNATKGVVVLNHEYSSARHVLYSDPGEQGKPKNNL